MITLLIKLGKKLLSICWKNVFRQSNGCEFKKNVEVLLVCGVQHMTSVPEMEVWTMNKSRQELFESSSIPKAFFALTIPTVLGKIVMLLYNMADTWFIAATVDKPKLKAIIKFFYTFQFCMSTVVALVLGVLSRFLVAAFMDEPAILAAGTAILRWQLVGMPFIFPARKEPRKGVAYVLNRKHKNPMRMHRLPSLRYCLAPIPFPGRRNLIGWACVSGWLANRFGICI